MSAPGVGHTCEFANNMLPGTDEVNVKTPDFIVFEGKLLYGHIHIGKHPEQSFPCI